MSDKEPQSKLAELLNYDTWPEADKEALLVRAGDIVLDASVTRLLMTLDDKQVSQLESHVDKLPEGEELLQYLLDTYQNFEKILEEEAVSFQEESARVMA